jgi:hypothetical protein
MAISTHAPETNFGTITSWVPLPTAFAYQAGCSSAIFAPKRSSPEEPFNVIAFDPTYGVAVDAAQKCLPEAATLWWKTDAASLTSQGITTRYSIGPIECPKAYKTAATFPVGDDRTQVACCPSYVLQYLFTHS